MIAETIITVITLYTIVGRDGAYTEANVSLYTLGPANTNTDINLNNNSKNDNNNINNKDNNNINNISKEKDADMANNVGVFVVGSATININTNKKLNKNIRKNGKGQ